MRRELRPVGFETSVEIAILASPATGRDAEGAECLSKGHQGPFHPGEGSREFLARPCQGLAAPSLQKLLALGADGIDTGIARRFL